MEINKRNFVFEWADNVLILGQRLGEWCGHGPVLEQDIALINTSLDLIGEARNLYQYLSMHEGGSEDDFALVRYENEYRNLLLVEQANGHWGVTIMRQLMFDIYHYYFLDWMSHYSRDEELKSIAAKSLKETKYHLKFSSEWTKRLGDGTQESHQKMQEAVDQLSPYFNECFQMSEADQWAFDHGVGPDLYELEPLATQLLKETLIEATLKWETPQYPKLGGKHGKHSEQMGYILAEMQYMQRAYPNMQW